MLLKIFTTASGRTNNKNTAEQKDKPVKREDTLIPLIDWDSIRLPYTIKLTDESAFIFNKDYYGYYFSIEYDGAYVTFRGDDIKSLYEKFDILYESYKKKQFEIQHFASNYYQNDRKRFLKYCYHNPRIKSSIYRHNNYYDLCWLRYAPAIENMHEWAGMIFTNGYNDSAFIISIPGDALKKMHKVLKKYIQKHDII